MLFTGTLICVHVNQLLLTSIVNFYKKPCPLNNLQIVYRRDNISHNLIYTRVYVSGSAINVYVLQ